MEQIAQNACTLRSQVGRNPFEKTQEERKWHEIYYTLFTVLYSPFTHDLQPNKQNPDLQGIQIFQGFYQAINFFDRLGKRVNIKCRIMRRER